METIRRSCFALLVATTSPALAQSSGWARLGEALAGGERREQEIYDNEMGRQYELAALRANASNLQAEARIRDRLIHLWQVAGLPMDEARSIAASFQINPSWEAILASVRRSGSQQGIKDLWTAYNGRNYALANDLLLSTSIVLQEENSAAAAAKAADEASTAIVAEATEEVKRAKTELDALGLRLEASDPEYRLKLDRLEPEIKRITATYPPSEWAQRFEAAYLALRL